MNEVTNQLMNTIKNTLFANWHPMRWIALAFGLFLGWNWLANSAALSGFLSAFFLFQAVTNTGCLCGSCAIPAADETASDEHTEFTEIK